MTNTGVLALVLVLIGWSSRSEGQSAGSPPAGSPPAKGPPAAGSPAKGPPAAASPSPGGGGRVAVIPLAIVGDVPAGRGALEAAVLKGLTVASVPTLQAGEVEARLKAGGARPACEDAACWSALGRALDARYLLTGVVERRGRLFAVEFSLVDARPGRVLATERNGCEADDCSVAELCRLTVRELARQNLSEGLDTAAPPPTLTAASLEQASKSAPPPESLALAAEADQPEKALATRKAWATAAIAAGTVTAGAGGFLIYYHFSCAERFDTGQMKCKRYNGSPKNEALIGGIAAAGIGAALLTTGALLFLDDSDQSDRGSAAGSARLTLGWGSLFLSGRF